MSLFYYAYANKVAFAPLQAPSYLPAIGAGAQPCSPRSMYSLAEVVSVSYVSIVRGPDVPESLESKVLRKTR